MAHALTRRSLLTATALGALGLVAAGCSDGGTDGAAAGAAPPPSGAGGFPRDVEHEVGTTRVESRPERVVAVTDGGELAAMLALGVVPVGFGQRNDPPLPWLVEAGLTDDVARYALDGEPDFEQMAAWAPDLLLGQYGFVTEDTAASFERLAPTIATSFIDWRESLRQVSQALGLDAEAERVVADVEGAADRLAAALRPAAGATVSMFGAYAPGEVYVYNDQSPFGLLVAQAGLGGPPPQELEGEAAQQLSLERLGDALATDVVLVEVSDSTRDSYEDLRSRGVLDALPAFQQGRVVELDGDDASSLYFSTALTVPWAAGVLERDLVPLLVGA